MTTRPMPIDVEVDMAEKAAEDAYLWVSNTSSRPPSDLKAYRSGFLAGWRGCLRVLLENGYVERVEYKPVTKVLKPLSKEQKRQKAQTERLIRDVARQRENL